MTCIVLLYTKDPAYPGTLLSILDFIPALSRLEYISIQHALVTKESAISDPLHGCLRLSRVDGSAIEITSQDLTIDSNHITSLKLDSVTTRGESQHQGGHDGTTCLIRSESLKELSWSVSIPDFGQPNACPSLTSLDISSSAITRSGLQ